MIGDLLHAQRPRHAQRLAILGCILPDGGCALGFVSHSVAQVTLAPRVAAISMLLHHSTFPPVTGRRHALVSVGPWLILSTVLENGELLWPGREATGVPTP